LALLAGALLLAGCGNSGGSSDSDSVPYTVGDAVSDSSVALIVSSEYGADTLSAQQYNRQAQQRLGRIPPQEQSTDTVQAIHRELVRSVAGQHMMRGRAQAADISVDSAQVEARFQKITQRYPDQETLRKQLAQSGMTMDSLRNYIATQMRAQQLQQQMAESAESPSDEEVDAYSKENRRIRAQHILLRTGQNASQQKVDSARSAAEALVDSAEAGADFSALARRHSEGPSAEKGGDLGFFTRNQMVDPFAEAAFALSDSGDVAPEPVQTRFGFHVIRLTNAGEPMDTTKARQQMMQERRRDAFNEELDALLQDATIRANPNVVEAGFYE
jgi:peptidyl-prolyl cis-trans isomerase C